MTEARNKAIAFIDSLYWDDTREFIHYDVEISEYDSPDFDPYEWISEEESICPHCNRVMETYKNRTGYMRNFVNNREMSLVCHCMTSYGPQPYLYYYPENADIQARTDIFHRNFRRTLIWWRLDCPFCLT